MTIPTWALLAFAAWTLLTLAFTHAPYRLGRVVTGRSKPSDFAEYRIAGEREWYERGMRAHANCLENLPVFAAIVIALVASDADGIVFDVAALGVIGARIPHTLVHVIPEQTNRVVTVRFTFFCIQWICMMAMIAALAWSGGPP